MPIRKQQTKQISIKKAFKRAQILQPDDTDELREEIHQLQQHLKEKQNMCFELQTEKYRRKVASVKSNTSCTVLPTADTETIIAKNEVEKLKDSMYRISLLTGMEVQSFKENDHCSVVFHMQHQSDTVIKHGLKIDLRNGRQHISEYALPLGFNLSGSLEGFDSVMTPDCLGAIRNALITYYDRLDQFEQLQKSVYMDAQLFKTLDASHVEISVTLCDVRDPEEDTIDLILVMKYRIHDIRPKQLDVKHIGPEHALETLLQQCTVFKKKPLLKAFDEAFVTGVGPYKIVEEEMTDSPGKEERHRSKPPHRLGNGNNDDTFRPEECSDSEDEE